MIQTKRFHSLINEIYSDSFKRDLIDFSNDTIIDSMIKQDQLFQLFRTHNIDAIPLGAGTNRIGVKIGNYCHKFAYNIEGYVDSQREFAICPSILKYGDDVVKIHEITIDGSIEICEYIQSFSSLSEMSQYQEEIINILRKWGNKYLIGDIGLTAKNCRNWGITLTGKVKCLDFAYFFLCDIKVFKCFKCGASMQYNNIFTELECPRCSNKESFDSLRKLIDVDNIDYNKMIQQVGYKMNSNFENHEIKDKSLYPNDLYDPKEFEKLIEESYKL